MPSDFSASPSSSAEQIMPWDSTPRILAARRVSPSGKVAPTRAKATFCPAFTFGAPQTTGILGLAVPDFAEGEPVGVRMLGAFLDQRGHDALQFSAEAFDLGDLKAERASVAAVSSGEISSGTKSFSQL